MKVIYIIKPRYFMHQERTELNILNSILYIYSYLYILKYDKLEGRCESH